MISFLLVTTGRQVELVRLELENQLDSTDVFALGSFHPLQQPAAAAAVVTVDTEDATCSSDDNCSPCLISACIIAKTTAVPRDDAPLSLLLQRVLHQCVLIRWVYDGTYTAAEGLDVN